MRATARVPDDAVTQPPVRIRLSLAACALCLSLAHSNHSPHRWRKKKCNICFHAFNVHKGVTVRIALASAVAALCMLAAAVLCPLTGCCFCSLFCLCSFSQIGDNDECYIDGVLSVSGGGASASASPPAAAAGGAGSAGFTSPIAERQQAFTHFQQQPKASPTAAHAHAPAAASEPASAPAASQPEKVVMVTSPVASGPPRRFAAPGSKAAASPAAAAPANAAAAPASTTVPAGGASSLSVPASVEASSAAHPSASSSGSKPSSKPASRASSKPGSRRGSVTKATVPGMIAEAKPYYVKALYSSVNSCERALRVTRLFCACSAHSLDDVLLSCVPAAVTWARSPSS